MFIKHLDLGGVSTLLVYVDEREMMKRKNKTLRQCLTKEFEIIELGRLKCFVGIKVAHFKQKIFIPHQNM